MKRIKVAFPMIHSLPISSSLLLLLRPLQQQPLAFFSKQSSASLATKTTTIEQNEAQSMTQKACFGAGCFWGTEKYFVRDFQKRFLQANIHDGKVGFMSIDPSYNVSHSPSYEEVCTGKTPFVEVFDFTFEEGGIDMYRKLCRFFFTFHDPTTLNRQGNDMGLQYASCIFVSNKRQQMIAEETIHLVQSTLSSSRSPKKVSTRIIPRSLFYPADDSHQQYLMKNPGGYCNHYTREALYHVLFPAT